MGRKAKFLFNTSGFCWSIQILCIVNIETRWTVNIETRWTVNIETLWTVDIETLWTVDIENLWFPNILQRSVGRGTNAKTSCSPIHPRLLRQSRFKPFLRLGYFLLRSVVRLHIGDLHALGWCKGPWALVTTLKAIILGVGISKKQVSQRVKQRSECSESWWQFMTSNTRTTIESTTATLQEIIFPSIYVCNVNQGPML